MNPELDMRMLVSIIAMLAVPVLGLAVLLLKLLLLFALPKLLTPPII